MPITFFLHFQSGISLVTFVKYWSASFQSSIFSALFPGGRSIL